MMFITKKTLKSTTLTDDFKMNKLHGLKVHSTLGEEVIFRA